MSDYISREDALLCATGEYADDSFEDSIRETECKKIAKRLKELKPADVKRDFVEIPKGMTNGEVIQTLFPNISIYEHGSTYSVNNEYNFNTTWWNAPHQKGDE